MTPEALLAWRKRLGLTQAEAAQRLGCGLRSIQKWEAGKGPVPHYIALATAAVTKGLKVERANG